MIVGLSHSSGYVFLMSPLDRSDVVGRNIARQDSLFLRHKESGQPTTIFLDVVNTTGERRLMVQRTVKPRDFNMDVPLEIAVSRPSKAIFAHWQHDLEVRALAFILMTAILSIGLYHYLRGTRRYQDKEAEAVATLIRTKN